MRSAKLSCEWARIEVCAAICCVADWRVPRSSPAIARPAARQRFTEDCWELTRGVASAHSLFAPACIRDNRPGEDLCSGADGQLGNELCGALGCFAQVMPATELDFDMTDQHALLRALEQARPQAIVNAAAYTDVDGAERDPSTAHKVNAAAVGFLGDYARANIAR